MVGVRTQSVKREQYRASREQYEVPGAQAHLPLSLRENMTAREEILTRIRTAIGPTTDPEAAWHTIARDYLRAGTLSREALLDLLEHRLRDYDATVYRTTAASLKPLLTEILTTRKKHRIAIDQGFPTTQRPDGITCIEDTPPTFASLNEADGVLTTATLAIAETGTIVLQSVPGQGRRALTLIPDYHLCLVGAATIVQTVPEAFTRLAQTPTLATTFFSGPSATADIEMTRIKGVHGPRFVDVVLIV